MFGLAVRTLRHRAGTFAAAFVAMVLGAAIVMACGGLMETGIRTAVPPQELAGADVVVAGEQRYDIPGTDESALLPERVRLDDDLVATVSAVDGVASAEGRVLDAPAPSGTVDAIAVTAAPGVGTGALKERIDAALDGVPATTLTGDARGQAEVLTARSSSEDLIALAGVFGGWATMVSMFGVASMLALSIQQRGRELALLRTAGATPGQLRRMVLGETLLLWFVATAAALVPGRFLGELLFERMADAGVVPAGIEFRQGWIPVVTAVGAALVAAVGGALIAGRRAAAVRPTQALTEAALDIRGMSPWRWLFGLLALSGGVALGIVTVTVMSGPLTSSTAGPAVILWAIGMALLSPVLIRGLTALLQWPLRAVAGTAGHLAVLNTRGRTSRTAAVVAPIIMLTGIATGTLYLQSTEDAANRDAFARGLVADAVVTSADPAGPELVERVAALPGVAGASALVRSTGFVETPHDDAQSDEGWTLQGVTAAGAAATTPVTPVEGALTGLTGDTVALAADHAHTLGVGIGDELTLRLGDGAAATVRVAATFDAADDYDTLLLPADLLAPHTAAGGVHEVLVAAEGDPDAVVAAVEELAAATPGLTVAGRDALFDDYGHLQRTMAFANYTVVIMIVAYAAISVINVLSASTGARRREFGLQRLTGATRAQVMRMVGAEGVLVAAVGITLGTLASAATLVPFSLARADSTTPSGSPLVYLGVVAVAVVLTLGATLLPARRALRQRAAEAARAAD
ncbi:FtsX-like permease family protein [Jiangella mangrovi]|uniref:Putative ABC transport system permease protein n=1 Tax=Jiangella mangrovi TaxID=1524084 RepID=A0A7W9LKA5_9ACTN|nr:ABC transporter permease [Jiangella mangrovi]MBB5786928.1 putative ABC transport system permease protein [Jiangella mangrovi]